MLRRLHIVVADSSLIIRSGLVDVLKRLNSLNIDVAEVSEMNILVQKLIMLKPDILIINASQQIGGFSVKSLKTELKITDLKIVALQNSLSDTMALKQFDEVISIYDSSDIIKDKIVRLVTDNSEINVKRELSIREKEIVVCVVKGMTNKQIADNLSLSTHTVVTHRKNIANKLKIHSPSGLTIYAIVTKLVEIDEIKSTIF